MGRREGFQEEVTVKPYLKRWHDSEPREMGTGHPRQRLEYEVTEAPGPWPSGESGP